MDTQHAIAREPTASSICSSVALALRGGSCLVFGIRKIRTYRNMTLEDNKSVVRRF